MGAPPEYDEGPGDSGGHGRGQRHSGEHLVASRPQGERTHAHQRTDGRSQDDCVVRMDDAVSEAEDGPGQQEPPPEQEEPGPDPIGAGSSPGQPQHSDQAGERTGNEP